MVDLHPNFRSILFRRVNRLYWNFVTELIHIISTKSHVIRFHLNAFCNQTTWNVSWIVYIIVARQINLMARMKSMTRNWQMFDLTAFDIILYEPMQALNLKSHKKIRFEIWNGGYHETMRLVDVEKFEMRNPQKLHCIFLNDKPKFA